MASVAGSRVLSQLQGSTATDTSGKKNSLDVIGSGAARAPNIEPTKVELPVPPGLSLPQDFPPLAAPSRPPRMIGKASQIAPSNIKPAVPVLPTPGVQSSTKTSKDVATDLPPTEPVSSLKQKDTTLSDLSSATVTGPANSTVEASSSHVKPSKESSTASHSRIRAASVEVAVAPRKSQKATEKRQLPGKLDIAAAKQTSKQKAESVALSKAQKSTEPSFPSCTTKDAVDSQPAAPTNALQFAQVGAGRSDQPRSTRVVPNSKDEGAAKSAVASPPVPDFAATTTDSTKPLSRRPSLTSVQGPGTPISDKISDNASFTSTSISRANSPPPSRVGTAPVRQTKAQQKRERQARAREAEKSKAEEEPIKPIAEEPVQAPIIGRKKKAKKITTSRGTADSTPAVTRPSSPAPHEEVTEEKLPSLPATPVKDPKKREMARTEAESPATPDTPAPASDPEQPKFTPSAAAIFAELQKSNDVSPTIENLFKSMASVNYRFDITPADFEDSPMPDLTADQLRALDKGECLYIELENKKPVVIMPDRQQLKHFSKNEAERYIELRKRTMNTPLPFRFLSPADEDLLQLRYPPYATGNPTTSQIMGGGGGAYDKGLDMMVSRFMEDPAAQQAVQEAQSTQGGPTLYTGATDRDSPNILTVEQAEEAMVKARKEHEAIEKKMNAVLKKNRRLVFGGGH